MNRSPTPQLEAMIQHRVEFGCYNNASEVVREAPRLLKEHERVQHLRSLFAVRLEQAQRGELVEFTLELVEDSDRRVEERFLAAARNRLMMCAHRPAIRLTPDADK